ncbi:MAG: Smr/MutS family protein [Gammaproteobacteria bacterium]|nr:Smr/MutS family protein [Gammaproteobacteria bacterium]MCW8840002.1 Smr/MutS family protein [Gammaproteobacteria bacterium]MCW8928573.1 Smr/MutS family protein [Gammaproteobacteria bacterium]MCW8958776.1 Smr/MutS family protein [Gammaproteobacteria bacterium]MCW8972224.1 Smr/MutS family protein [Gammaproteobacteria bacterium]
MSKQHKQHEPSDEEKALFRSAVADAQPLPQKRILPRPPPPPPHPRLSEEDEARVLEDMLSDYIDPAELETGEELFYCRAGLQHSVLRKLRRGHYAIGAELDLHGMRVAEARQALSAFLQTTLAQQIKTVRIIHGKGNGSLNKQPVLKGKVNNWLRQRIEVLAFCSARPVDGGTGAVYVLLRRARR